MCQWSDKLISCFEKMVNEFMYVTPGDLDKSYIIGNDLCPMT
jgi:hypothetical protein